jgi:hypothetical protein
VSGAFGAYSRRPRNRDVGKGSRAPKRARILCHVPAERRPDSFELGGCKGNNGREPGLSGFGLGTTDHYAPAHDTGRLHLCPHPACVGEVARRVRRGRGLGSTPANWGETSR